MMKVCALFVVAAAYRISETDVLERELEMATESDNVTVEEDPQVDIMDMAVVSPQEFNTMQHTVLSHQLEIKPGEQMVLELQEHRKALKMASYSIFLTQKNGQRLPRHIQVAELKSKAFNPFSFKYKYDLITGSKRIVLKMEIPFLPKGGAMIRAKVIDAKGKFPYYSFAMQSRYGMSNQQRQGQLGMVNKNEEVFSVYKGKAWAGTPILQAKGHFAGWAFQFWKAGQAAPVAQMQMIDNQFSVLSGSKQRYAITIESGVDPVMLSMLIGFIDACNNLEQEQHWH